MADPLDFSDKYNTPIPPARQGQYADWRAALPKPLQSQRDYDLQGAFLNGTSPDVRDHMTDQFKKPNHPTFSDASQYHGIDGYVGGSWTDKGYQPSTTNLQMRSPDVLQHYFDDIEKQTVLLPPQPVPSPTGSRGQYRISDFAPPAPAAAVPPPAAPQPQAPRKAYR